MTIFIWRGDGFVEKGTYKLPESEKRSDFPTPMLSPRLETFESPVTGKAVTSWRDRDRDMAAADAVDPRDIPKKALEKRATVVERMKAADG
jgi:hypothetical protein